MKPSLPSLLLVAAMTMSAGAAYDRPSGPNHDLTQTLDFPRVSTYVLGPIGASGWMYTTNQMTHLARQVLITAVEPGAPAEGVLQEGDVLLGLDGQPFTSDARRALGWAIVEAEQAENGGSLRLTRWRPVAGAEPRQGTTEEVVVTLPTHPAFADTAPYACTRSEAQLQEALGRVAANVKAGKLGRLNENLLALMAGGQAEHLELVREAIAKAKWAQPDFTIDLDGRMRVWASGMDGLILTEYYLITGDKSVLPALREHAVKVAMGQSGGGLWGHSFARPKENGGKLHGRLPGYGALNLAGLPCLITLTLAEQCGIEHPEIDDALDRALPFFANFVGHGTIGYGYHRANLDFHNNGHNGFSSNGKNSLAGLALTFAGDREAAQYYAMLVTSSYDEREYGHAGNSFNRFWGMMGANLGGPDAVAAFHREMRWYDALCRGWDGRMLYQQLGGYYGGVTLDLEAAQVMAMALPLRHLVITGRNPNKDFWLSRDQVREAIDAGRWHWADYSRYTSDQLIEELDCWSPGAREWMAAELGRRNEPGLTHKLVAAANSARPDQRAGALAALGYQGERGAAALGTISEGLHAREATVRAAAAYAMMRAGHSRKDAVSPLLKAIVALPQEGPLQPSLQAMAYSLGAPPGRTAPLYFVGILPQVPEGVNPLDGIDRELVYRAFTRLATDRSGRIRQSGGSLLPHFQLEDAQACADTIFQLATEKSPDFGMFSGRARGTALELMARYKIAEGPALTTRAIDNQGWGFSSIFPHQVELLGHYGAAAKDQLPWLRAKREEWAKKPEQVAVVDAVIAAIEGDDAEPETISLAEWGVTVPDE